MVSIARSPPLNTTQHSYASRISESTMVLSHAPCPLLRGTMVVASGNGDGNGNGNGNGNNGGGGDSNARCRIAEVGKHNGRSQIAEVGQCDARSCIAKVGRCDAMAACGGDEAGCVQSLTQ
jgi:hypothetical protein